ncbi:replication initiation protein [Adhaeribacter rhizoryzae]|uniref:Replication initiation protein n=1 Tax=Adhaeribacter rhizoryzae TaxID=2607907 RepID=A0A5M6CYF9_9BACT|nr:replication initiation protein [Adhaeribacter rhizoryzae]KAA5539032.1 replication initiation protein [Adhaeribacter rhizoryzae]
MKDHIGIPLKKPNKIVTQSNSLINSCFDIPTVQLRAFLYSLGHINKEDKELTHVKIPIDVLHASKGGKNYKQVKKLVSELQEIKFKIESFFTNKDGIEKKAYRSMVIFPTVDYTEDNRYLITKINSDLAPFLLDLKGNYTQAELEQLLSLKTIQAYRIYMFIKQELFKKKPEPIKYKHLRLMLGLDIELEEDEVKKVDKITFKPNTDLFGEIPSALPPIPNVKVVKYPLFAEFKRRILDTAKAELANTEMAFNYKLKKKGRNVDTITFELIKTVPIQAPSEEKLAKTSELPDEWKRPMERMLEYGLTEKQATYIIERVPIARIKEDLNPVLYRINAEINSGDHSKLKRTKGQHSVIIIKEVLGIKYNLWQKEQSE